jgi:hypothetical protein
MVLRVHRDADGLAHDPVVGQRLGPQRIDLEAGSGDGGGFDDGMFLEQNRSDTERTRECQESQTNVAIALHTDEPSLAEFQRGISAASQNYSLIAGKTEAVRARAGRVTKPQPPRAAQTAPTSRRVK